MEILANYEPNLHFISEWWKQLYGESEGKDGKGIFPASVDFSTDLHSLGQFIQDGSSNHFETVLNVEEPELDIVLEAEENDLDGLNYLAGKTMNFVNQNAMKGTILAHVDGGVPNLRFDIPKMDAYHLDVYKRQGYGRAGNQHGAVWGSQPAGDLQRHVVPFYGRTSANH